VKITPFPASVYIFLIVHRFSNRCCTNIALSTFEVKGDLSGMQRSIAGQVEAERERRAKIIAVEVEY
jgi:hypothetical protein